MDYDLNLQATCYQPVKLSSRDLPMFSVVFEKLLFLESIGSKNMPVFEAY